MREDGKKHELLAVAEREDSNLPLRGRKGRGREGVQMEASSKVRTGSTNIGQAGMMQIRSHLVRT